VDVSLQHVGRCLIVSPRDPLVAGGPAEDFERVAQDLIRHGYPHVVADLQEVSQIDSAGVRAIVRAHTTAQRRGVVFRLARANPQVRHVLALAQLGSVLPIFDTLDEARSREVPWRTIGLVAGGVLLCAGLVAGGLRWTDELAGLPQLATGSVLDTPATSQSRLTLWRPALVLVKLLAAALVGLLVTAVHRPSGTGRQNRAMEHAQVLLCVSGTMMMIIIGDSLARAFGIAGAASIIRFRTPVDDPKDVTVLFLLMGLGMAVGLGAFAAAGLATAFLCVFLMLLSRAAEQRVRPMVLEVASDGPTFPMGHVQGVLARNSVTVEPREVEQEEKEVVVKYHALLPPEASLEDLSSQLLADGKRGVRSVSWEAPKKNIT
jgi:anti-anti-sigma factor